MLIGKVGVLMLVPIFAFGLSACSTPKPVEILPLDIHLTHAAKVVNRSLALYANSTMHANFSAQYGEHPLQALDIYLPNNIPLNGAPAVMYVHGGGWIFGDKIEVRASKVGIDKTMRALLDNGFAVVAINYRTAPRYTIEAQIHDAQMALDFIINNHKKYHLDKTRIGVLGNSAGGHLAQWLATQEHPKVQAAVAMYAPANLDKVVEINSTNSAANCQILWQAFVQGLDEEAYKVADVLALVIGAPYASVDFGVRAKKFSPIYRVHAKSAPTLLIHGEQDCLVAPKQSQDYAEALAKAGVAHELVIVQKAGHGGEIFWKSQDYQQQIVAFLKQYLQN